MHFIAQRQGNIDYSNNCRCHASVIPELTVSADKNCQYYTVAIGGIKIANEYTC